jgi:hypothetical protein
MGYVQEEQTPRSLPDIKSATNTIFNTNTIFKQGTRKIIAPKSVHHFQAKEMPCGFFFFGNSCGNYLSETENVVNKQKHILSFSITEMFSNSQTSQPYTSTSTRGLVHLPIDKSTLAFTLPQKAIYEKGPALIC